LNKRLQLTFTNSGKDDRFHHVPRMANQPDGTMSDNNIQADDSING